MPPPNCDFGIFSTILPSSILTIRSASRAISLLWVIMTMVWLNSMLVRFKSPSTSALVLESRFPVGSSARMLALQDKLQNMPNNLSGGQQQRVAIARALITKPAIILADEPTGNLDSRTSADVLGLLKRTSMEFNQTIVMITHNNEIAQLADRIIRIEDGRIAEKIAVGGN